MVALHPQTRADAAEEFGGLDRVPAEALTVGLRTLLAARELLVLVTGAGKAEALRAMLMAPPGSGFPASLLRTHPRLTVICDEPAAQALRGVAGGDHVCVVLGHRDPGFSHEHRISRESLGGSSGPNGSPSADPPAPWCYGVHSTGGLPRPSRCARPGACRGCPPCSRSPGATPPGTPLLPADRARAGRIREVTVVTSAWHVRAPYMFAPWRRHGLRLRFAVDRRGDWPRMLARELHEAPAARRERRDAFAAVPAAAFSGLTTHAGQCSGRMRHGARMRRMPV